MTRRTRYKIDNRNPPAYCTASCRVCRFWMAPKDPNNGPFGPPDMGVCDRLGARLSEQSLCDRFEADERYKAA